MGTCSRLATMIDADMLARHGTRIALPGTPDSKLHPRSPKRVAQELGKRYLLRYLLPSQLKLFGPSGPLIFAGAYYVTPTPLSPEETVPWLALPDPNQPRPYVLLLKPEKINDILGPRWIRMGGGIEYILPKGFSRDAIVDIGTTTGTKWPLLVT